MKICIVKTIALAILGKSAASDKEAKLTKAPKSKGQKGSCSGDSGGKGKSKGGSSCSECPTECPCLDYWDSDLSSLDKFMVYSYKNDGDAFILGLGNYTLEGVGSSGVSLSIGVETTLSGDEVTGNYCYNSAEEGQAPSLSEEEAAFCRILMFDAAREEGLEFVPVLGDRRRLQDDLDTERLPSRDLVETDEEEKGGCNSPCPCLDWWRSEENVTDFETLTTLTSGFALFQESRGYESILSGEIFFQIPPPDLSIVEDDTSGKTFCAHSQLIDGPTTDAALSPFALNREGVIACHDLFVTTVAKNEQFMDFDGCFPPDAIVNVLGKGAVRMDTVRVGDKVESATGYSEVYTFGNAHDQTTQYLQLNMEDTDEAIELSGNHMIFIGSKRTPVLAADVRVGDRLTLMPSGNTSRVKSIKTIVKEGRYQPMTYDGTIIVNGVLASVHIIEHAAPFVSIFSMTLINLQSFQQMLYAPLRMLCKANPEDFCLNEKIYDEFGTHPWNDIVEHLVVFLTYDSDYCKECNFLKTSILLPFKIFVLFWMIVFYLIENCTLFGSALFVGGAACVYIYHRHPLAVTIKAGQNKKEKAA